MEICKDAPSEKEVIERLYSLFLEKGYPLEALHKEVRIAFSLADLTFEIFLPLVVKKEKPILITYYEPSLRGLSCAERPLISIARLFFDPLPYFAILTNLQNYIKIEVPSQRITKGGKEIIPTFEVLNNYTPTTAKPFKRDLEEKILALYLSGGCKRK